MSEQNKLYDHSIDLGKNSIKNAKINPLTTTQRLSLSLSSNDDGYPSYDITLKKLFIWDGTQWVISGGNKTDIGLGNVDNTSDEDKPISTATQTALDLKTDNVDFIFENDIPVVLPPGEKIGPYSNGDIILAEGKNPLEVIRMLVTAYLFPEFSSFTINEIPNLFEVGVPITGTKTFTWNTINNQNIIPNSINIDDYTNEIYLIQNAANDGSQVLNIGTIPNTIPIFHQWQIVGYNTNEQGFSALYSINTIYPIFYGVSNTAPIANQALINSGTKAVVDSTGTINITFGASGQYPWFAYPESSTTKTKWFVDALNQGNIGSNSDLFNTPSIVSIDSPSVLWNGINYKVCLANIPTTTSGNMELKNS